MRAPRIRSSKTITHSWQSSGGKQRANRCPFSVVTVADLLLTLVAYGGSLLISWCSLLYWKGLIYYFLCSRKQIIVNKYSYHAIYSNLWSYLYFHFKVVQHLWCTNVSIREPPRNGPSKSSTKGYALESVWKLQKIYLFSN